MKNVIYKKFTKQISGFTLIELLVVMSIIAFLLLASLAGLTYGLKKARDTSRMRAVSALQTALLAYYNDNLQFPIPNVNNLDCPYSVQGSDNNNYHQCTVTSLIGLTDNGAQMDPNADNAALSQYFEQEFRSPINISGTKDLDNAMAYYVDDSGSKYAICTLTELSSSGNIQAENLPSEFQAKKWGCYCEGPLGNLIKCAGLHDPNGSDGQ